MNIIVFLISVWFYAGVAWLIISVIESIRDGSLEAELKAAAKEAACTKDIIKMAESLAQAQVSKVECRISVNEATTPGIEVIQIDLVRWDKDLSRLYSMAKDKYYELGRNRALAEINKSPLASKFQEQKTALLQFMRNAILLYFPCESAANAVLDAFCDLEDIKANQSNYSVSAFRWIFVDSLGIGTSVSKRLRSPYVIDAATEEIRRRFPSVVLTVDKTVKES